MLRHSKAYHSRKLLPYPDLVKIFHKNRRERKRKRGRGRKEGGREKERGRERELVHV
jgi:hypothetical protein